MSTEVPADDLPDTAVPTDDLPSTGGEQQDNSSPSLLQQATAIPRAVASAAINTLAPLGASIESLVTRRPYAEVKKAWQDTPDNPAARDVLSSVGNAPVIKQIGQLLDAGGDKLADVTGMDRTAARDLVNTASLGVGPARGLFTKAAKAADMTAPAVENLWKMNPADSLANRYIINYAWAQQIGENAIKLTQDVLGRAQDRIGAVFNYVRNSGKQYSVALDPTEGALKGIAEKWTPDVLTNGAVSRLMRDLRAGADEPNVGIQGTQNTDWNSVGFAPKVTNPGTATITAQRLGSAASEIGEAAQNAGTWELKKGLFEVKNHIEDLLQAGLSPAEQQLYQTARSQYRALHGQLFASKSLNTVTGNVNAAKMGAFLESDDVSGFALNHNQGEAYNAARFGRGQEGTLKAPLDPTNKVGAIMKAAVSIGVPFQWAAQRGPAAILRTFAGSAPFRTALAAQLGQGAQQGSGGEEDGGGQQ